MTAEFKSDSFDLKAAIRTIPDYPKPGILFRDITTLLGDARAFRRAIDELVQPWCGAKIDKVAGMEARGFILGGAVAHQLSAGFVPIRKKGKLPHTKVSIAYSLEYGLDEMEIHQDAVVAGEKVILVDDLIATGGTAAGAVGLLKKIGADVVAACFVIDLPDLGGADKIRDARRAGAHLDELSGALTQGRKERACAKRRPQSFSISSGTILKRSPTSPMSATWKIGASSSLLMAMIVFKSFMPARCWIAPEMPIAR